jgi:ERF superfamily
MKKSESIINISAALIKAQSEFPNVPKTKEVIVQTQKGAYVFKYAPLENIISITRPVLFFNGLGFTQGVDGDSIVTTILHNSGEWIAYRMPFADIPQNQIYGSNFTYRRRYALKAALGIETDDDDADMTHTDDGKKKKATPMAGVMDSIPKERHGDINRMASTIVDCFTAGDSEEAFKAYSEIKNNEEKMAVWSFLDSKMRRTIKQIGEQRKGQANANQHPVA